MAVYLPRPPQPAESLSSNVSTLEIAAENTFTRQLVVHAGEVVSVSVAGSFDATVVLYRMLDGSSWRAVPNSDGTVGWTAPTEQVYDADEACLLRLGIPAGDYVSGTASCRLGKG